jgi:hypothetical protein
MTSKNTAIAAILPGVSDYRNKLINGDFIIWNRATTQTLNGYGSADRWNNAHNGSTKTTSLQPFTLGQTDVPGNPIYYSRTVVTSAAAAANYTLMQQCLEYVNSCAGQRVTVTFYAKADTTRNIAIDFVQNFGSGGSTIVAGIGAQTFNLTTTWKKCQAVIDIPSIAGKTIGSTYGYLALRIWFDAGSTYNAYTNSLGQQSGTFDIAHASVIEGDATSEVDPFSPRALAHEVTLCQRYFQRFDSMLNFTTYANAGGQVITFVHFAPMRTNPSFTFNNVSYSNGNTGTVHSSGINWFAAQHFAGASAGQSYMGYGMYLDAEIN